MKKCIACHAEVDDNIDKCPMCGRPEKDHNRVGFERIRRITGYLVGTLDRFNDAKRSEVIDRVKHGCCPGDDE